MIACLIARRRQVLLVSSLVFTALAAFGFAHATSPATAETRSVAEAAKSTPVKIVAFGDSLVAGFGLGPRDAFPAQLERALRERGYAATVINAGVSGDTTAGGLARLEWALPDDADAVILELGANDALRGLPPENAKANLEQMLVILEKRKLPVLIAGMRAPNNWGTDYAAAFNAIFPDLAEAHGALLYPFFLEGVALQSELNQADAIHPNPKGVAEIVKRILPSVEQLIVQASQRAGQSG